jgi:hypothetical protein
MSRRNAFEWEQYDRSEIDTPPGAGWSAGWGDTVKEKPDGGISSPPTTTELPRIDTVAMFRPAERKKRNRDWEKRNPLSKYRGVSPDVHHGIKEISGQLSVGLSEVARAFLEYGLSLYHAKKIRMSPSLKEGRFTLYPNNSNWTDHRAWLKSKEINASRGSHKPLGKSKQQRKDQRRWEQEVAYRIPREVHSAVKEVADHLDVPVGEVVMAFFNQSMDDYRTGELNLFPKPKSEKRTLFPE